MPSSRALGALGASALLLLLSAVATARSEEVKPLRALLVTGGCCHDYTTQKELLSSGISERAAVEWTIVHQGGTGTDSRIPLYEDPEWAEGFDVVVHDECFSNVKDPAWTERILKPHREGVPAVVLHCAMHCYRDGTDAWFEFCGVTSHGHGAHYPFEVVALEPKDPILAAFGDRWKTPQGELYLISKVWPRTTPLAWARSRDTGKDEVCVWKSLYGPQETRVFGTTIGHHNETVSSPVYLDLVTRGLLWAAGRLDERHLKKVLVPVNLALDKPARASTTQSGNEPGNAVDGDPGTRWCASDASPVQSWQVDLGEPREVRGVRIVWEFGGRRYRYRIEGSLDGEAWSTLVDATRSEERTQVRKHEFDLTTVRHLRVSTTESEGGAWVSFWELEVHGTEVEELSPGQVRRRATAALLRGVRHSDELDGTVFAAPPEVNYPASIAVAPTGEVFVAVDKNSSLDKETGRGSILRCVDDDDDGHADHVSPFVESIDSPRGLFFDAGSLWVVHQPSLSVFRDVDGDGAADEHEVLVEGLGFSLRERPADHTSNGLRLAIDGWLYIAIGDFGFVDAVGKDGARLQLRGGGVVRVRPDGTEMELFARGTRNIYDYAVGPLLDGFTRDNTNDGGGWDIRLSHIVPMSHLGYPSLYKHFDDEILPALADYGGGSGTGGLWIDEPGMPEGLGSALLTCDWGRNKVYRHPLERHGASWKAGQVDFLDVPRPTDLDVDGAGRIYVASWRGGQYRYDGEDIGFVLRLAPRGAAPRSFPDLAADDDPTLAGHLASPSHVLRLAAQREILRRGERFRAVDAVERVAAVGALPSRIAAIFTLKQLLAEASHPVLGRLAADPVVREYALRALADRRTQLAGAPERLFVEALADSDPRVRLQALVGIARLDARSAASQVLPLTSDPDTAVAHTAHRVLVALRGVAACLSALDSEDLAAREGALRALRYLHDERAVSGLIARLGACRDPGLRRGLVATLVRLYHREAEWKGDSWGTRPDTTGPYYRRVAWEQTERIAAALATELREAPATELEPLLAELDRHVVRLDGALAILAERARTQDAAGAVVAEWLGRPAKPSREALELLEELARSGGEGARRAANEALARRRGAESTAPLVVAPKAAIAEDAIGKQPFEEVLSAVVSASGDAERGRRVFEEKSCGSCHTVSQTEAPKGPYLGDVAKRYARKELATSILRPSAQVAQGFATNWFVTNAGAFVEGFVVREAADEVELRNVKGEALTLAKASIVQRGKSDKSVMPEGLLDDLPVTDLASLLAYLESLAPKD